MFNTIRVISRHQDTQIYGTILLDVLTNQEMLDSKAYKEYYAVASGTEPSKAKPKYKKKAYEPVIPSKSKSAPTSKGKRLKSPAKTQFHSSHASGPGNGVDTQSKLPDEQQQKISGTDEGAGDKPEVPDVPKYNLESDEESWTFNQDEEDADEESDVNDDSEETKSDNDGDNLTYPTLSTYKTDDEEEEEDKTDNEEEEEEKADNDEIYSDQRVFTPPEYELTDEDEENQEGDDQDMEGEHEQDDEDDLYRDVNINLERSDVEMTNAQANQDTEDSHVILTPVLPVVHQQSSSVSSDLVSKFINPSPDTCIDSILRPNIQSHTLVNVLVSITVETPSFATTIPPPPIPIIQPLQQTS
ncbi:hypothetical protein Tco_0847891 [Tanacetum coccineum]